MQERNNIQEHETPTPLQIKKMHRSTYFQSALCRQPGFREAHSYSMSSKHKRPRRHTQQTRHTATILFGTLITRTSRTQRLMNAPKQQNCTRMTNMHERNNTYKTRETPTQKIKKTVIPIHIIVAKVTLSTQFSRDTSTARAATQATTSPHTANQQRTQPQYSLEHSLHERLGRNA